MSAGEKACIKFEPFYLKVLQFSREYQYNEAFGEAEGIPKLYFFGQSNKYNALVIELFKNTIQHVFEISRKKFLL